MKSEKVKVFYHPAMANMNSYTSKFMLKPKLFMDFLNKENLDKYIDIDSYQKPITNKDLLLAHTQEYINSMLNGDDLLSSSNNLEQSEDFVLSCIYNISSLYESIKYAINNPEQLTLSPSQGFHNAMPNKGANFCTFSGQAIASMKIYKELKKSGAYIDLDLHYGNSIDDTRLFNKTLNKAIPKGFNFNPKGKQKYYVSDLQDKLNQLEKGIKNGKIDYVVVAHGANSHIEDDMMGQLTTEQQLECSRMVYNTLSLYDIPIIISLFGGCREDDYDNVLKLHTADLIEAINILTCQCIDYNPIITKNKGRQDFLKITSNINQYVRFQ